MYCRVLAVDFDGTGASGGALAPQVASALKAARERGITSLLVTGRVLEDLEIARVDFSAFDAVVAENGAVVWLSATGRRIHLGEAPSEAFLGRLRAAGIPFHVGDVVVGTWDGHAAQALALVREAGLDLQLVFNRAALMLLPSGVNKAWGVRRALAELGRSPRNMIAFGDAENDLPLFELAEIGVAARGSVPAAAAAADDHLAASGPEGVAQYVERLRAAGDRAPSPARHRIVLGRTDDGTPVALPAGDVNVLVSGDPRSGKSWLAGLLAERLLEDGYRLCIIDPEGDHHALGERSDVVPLGHRIQLPAPADLPGVMQEVSASLVLTLTGLSQAEKSRYVCATIERLAAERALTGMPHWTFVDEAHYFFRPGADCCARLLAGTGNVVLATYRPSLLAPELHDSIQANLLTCTEVDDERYFVAGLLGARGPSGLAAAEALGELRMPRAGLLLQTPDGPRWQTLLPADRVVTHAHHERKYVDSALPEKLAFRFRATGNGSRPAHNVREFAEAIATVPIASLRHHLLAGDFSRWAHDVLGDPDLAAGLAKLERTASLGAPPNRAELLDHLRDRYQI